MLDFRTLKLGRSPSPPDDRTLRLARYLIPALPAPPVTVDWSMKLTTLGMMLNDQLGDCTCAAMGHAEQVWTSQNGPEITVPDSAVLAAYEGACGYVPGDPSTDQGGNMLTMVKYWRKTGIAGHKISAFVQAQPSSLAEVKTGLWLFGGLYTGVALPLSAQAQIQAGQPWAIPLTGTQWGDGVPGSWGGHCIWVCAYDPQGLTCLTWGMKQRMTWDFWRAYCDECMPILAPEWDAKGKCPVGFDAVQLEADLEEL